MRVVSSIVDHCLSSSTFNSESLTLDWTGLDSDWNGLWTGLHCTGLEWGGGYGVSALSISFGLLLLIFFGFITNNHSRSIVHTAACGAISF